MGDINCCSPAQSTGSTTDSIARPAAAARTGLVLSLVDFEGPTGEILAVERLHRARRVRTRHLDEPEAARLARVAVIDQRKLLDGAVRSEKIANRFFGGREGRLPTYNLVIENLAKKKGETAACKLASCAVRETSEMAPGM